MQISDLQVPKLIKCIFDDRVIYHSFFLKIILKIYELPTYLRQSPEVITMGKKTIFGVQQASS